MKIRNPRKTPTLKQWHTNFRLEFPKTNLLQYNDYFKLILWSDESKILLSRHNNATHVWVVIVAAYSQKNTIPTMKHGGSNILIREFFSYSGTEEIRVIYSTVKSAKYIKISEDCLQSSGQKI